MKASAIFPIAFCIVALGVVAWGMIYSINIPDNKKVFGGDELYYTDSVSVAEVDKLGNYFTTNQVFNDDGKTISSKINKIGDTLLVIYYIRGIFE